MGGKILFIVIVIFALGIGLYLFNSGAVGSTTGFFGSLLGNHSSTVSFSNPSGNSGSPGTTYYLGPPNPTSSYSDAGGANGSISPSDIPAGFTISQISPYFHQIRFGGVSASSYNYPGTITLSSYPNQGIASIDVTGWEIKTNKGGEYLPTAVNIYDPSGLAAASDIRLFKGDILNIYSTSAPVNLRLNECIGYLPNKSQFNPQLPLDCPYPDRSLISSFSGACQNFIQSIGTCQSPNLSSPLIPQNDYSCVNFLNNNFTYYSCFEQHESDPNFLMNTINVWMGGSPLDPFHDQVELLDKNGLLVDLYKY